MLALKEWACIVDALGKGKQSLTIRKGGIAEDTNQFTVKGNEFLLYPTLFHQAETFIKPQWQPFLKHQSFHPTADKVVIKYFAKVADVRTITDYNQLKKLSPFHAWTDAFIEEKFNRWNKSVEVLILQIFALGAAQEIEILPTYGGCNSWIDIQTPIECIGKPIINQSIV
jgi:hypothetical protein